MKAGTTFRFARVARALADATRAAGFVPPAFRSPPRGDGVDRAIRRCPTGSVVAVRLAQRPFDAAVADMVEGVVAAIGIDGGDAYRLRGQLWEALANDAGTSDGDDSAEDPAVEAGDEQRHAEDVATRPGVGGPDCADARMAERQTQAA